MLVKHLVDTAESYPLLANSEKPVPGNAVGQMEGEPLMADTMKITEFCRDYTVLVVKYETPANY